MQKLDLILEGKKKYMEIAPISYCFIASINTIVKDEIKFFELSLEGKFEDIIKTIQKDSENSVKDISQ